jgi:uncharacterized protein YbjQ (UPF0145 family)
MKSMGSARWWTQLTVGRETQHWSKWLTRGGNRAGRWRWCVAPTLLLMSACSSTGTTITADFPVAEIAPELEAVTAEVIVATDAPEGAKTLGNVEAVACQKYNFSPLPTDELALALLKQEAVKLGANTIVDVTISHSNVDFARNCFTTIYAKGVALLAEPQ